MLFPRLTASRQRLRPQVHRTVSEKPTLYTLQSFVCVFFVEAVKLIYSELFGAERADRWLQRCRCLPPPPLSNVQVNCCLKEESPKKKFKLSLFLSR